MSHVYLCNFLEIRILKNTQINSNQQNGWIHILFRNTSSTVDQQTTGEVCGRFQKLFHVIWKKTRAQLSAIIPRSFSFIETPVVNDSNGK